MEKIPQKVFKATVSSAELVAQGVKKITCKISEPFSFSVGQYVWVEIPNIEGETKIPKGSRRAFSVCNMPNKENTISVIGRISESAFKQKFFAFSEGDEVTIHGPFGSTFIIGQNSPKDLIMIAGGVAIAPFLPIIETIKTQSLPIKCFLFYLNRNQESTPFLKELEALKENNKFFDYKVKYDVFSWDDIKYTCDGLEGERKWWVAGPQAMVGYVYGELEKGGISMFDMAFENYYPIHPHNLTLEKIKEQLQGEGILAQAIQNSASHTIITDANGVVLFANKAAEEITGYTVEEMLGNTPRLWGGMMSDEFYKNFWARKRMTAQIFIEGVINRRKNGEAYYANARITTIFDEEDEIIGFVGTEEDVTNAKEIDQAKTELIFLASHQLRTPLSAINWYTEMLLEEEAGKLNDKQKEYVDEVYKGSQRMVNLVDTLLDVSRFELGTFVLDLKPVDIVSFAKSMVKELKVQIDEKKLKCEERYSKEMPLFNADQKSLRIIFQNLLSNAITYTPSKGEVVLDVRMAKQGDIIGGKNVGEASVAVIVSDTGYGIPKAQQDKIFTKLFRADNVRGKNIEGTGLGLYMVQATVEQAGGSIWFESEENKGTTFYVLLPLIYTKKKEATKAP